MGKSVDAVFAGAARSDQSSLLELGQLGRDSGLFHAQNPLQLGDGELFLIEEDQEAEAGWIAEKTQGIYEGGHSLFP